MIFTGNAKNLKIEAYELCPCGSGKKFKFCCYKKAKTFDMESLKKYQHYSDSRLNHEIQKYWEDTDFSTCFGFDQENCRGTIKSAHSIQNNEVHPKS